MFELTSYRLSNGISGHLDFNSLFLNETKADLVVAHAQVKTSYWLPIAITKVVSS